MDKEGLLNVSLKLLLPAGIIMMAAGSIFVDVVGESSEYFSILVAVIYVGFIFFLATVILVIVSLSIDWNRMATMTDGPREVSGEEYKAMLYSDAGKNQKKDTSASVRKCISCGSVLDKDAKSCPKCFVVQPIKPKTYVPPKGK